jgi:transcriptional regulator GlxA family with amidase domain
MTFRPDPLPDGAPELRVQWPAEWPALLRTRAHVLLTGSHDATHAFLEAARSELREPIHWVLAGGALRLPTAPTIVVRDVHTLTAATQRELLQWLNDDRNRDVQLVAVTPTALLPLVEAGLFDAIVYYRLNTIHIELSPD